VFSWRGVGQALYEGFSQKDYPVLQVLIMAAAGIYVFVNLLVDITYALIDPRIRTR
jgi:peptide/nickel transport system permease protein